MYLLIILLYFLNLLLESVLERLKEFDMDLFVGTKWISRKLIDRNMLTSVGVSANVDGRMRCFRESKS